MDEVRGKPDREEAHRDERNAEEGVDRRRARPAWAVLEREPQHEVRAVEEEEHEEEHELVRAPRPPDTPRGASPDRAGDQRERAEDGPLVDGDVAFEVVPLVATPQEEQRLDRSEPEAEVRRESDRDVDVEDALRDPLIRVLRRDDEREDESEPHGERSDPGESREAAK